MFNVTEPPTEEEQELWLLPFHSLIPAIIFIGGMILLAVGGNILIILSYFRDKQLQTVHNLYILNLAFTDLFLACISMPFYAVYTLTAQHWPFGRVFCKFFLVVDFTLCLESVLLIIVISLDRLILVTSGAYYTSKETFKVGRIKILVSWLFAFSLYSPAIIGWDYWTGQSSVDPGDCNVEFAYNFLFTLITSLIEFFVPFMSISVLNILIYMKIRRRKNFFANKINTAPVVQHISASTTGLENPCNETREAINQQFNSSPTGVCTTGARAETSLDSKQKSQQATTRKNVKAARALGVLVLALAVCWAPYTIATVIVAVCEDCVNSDLYEVLNWLLWFKSCINPFLYAVNSLRFRNNMKKLLFFWR